MKLKRWEMSLMLGLVLTIFTGALWAADATTEQQALANKLLRLHVIANSDSDDDQALKLKVRDAVFAAATEWVSDATDSQQAEEIILAHQKELQTVAKQVICTNGYQYPVKVEIGISDFPTKDYDGFSLPAGKYRALRIILGEGKGQNWWCVVFPPLCVQAASKSLSEDAKQAGLTDSQVKLITEADNEYVYRFKSIEILDSVLKFLGL